MTEVVPTPGAQSPSAAARRRSRWTRRLSAALLVLALAVALTIAALWAPGTESGSAWLLAQLPRLAVEQPRGALLGSFSAKRIVVHLSSANDDRLVIDEPRWSTPRLAYVSDSDTWFAIAMESFSAQRVTLQLAPGDKPPALPTNLRMPVRLDVAALHIGELVLAGLEGHPLHDVNAHLQLGADNGREHRLDELSLRAGLLQLRGRASIGAESPLPLALHLDATQSREPGATDAAVPAWAQQALRGSWQAQLKAQGPLARFQAQASLRAQGQSLDAQALVTPVEAWPLTQLDARTERLDLSALLAGAPTTALTGQIRITPAPDGTRSLRARAEFTNQIAGRWDAQRLPLRKFSLDVSSPVGQTSHFELTTLDAVLAADGRDAGTLQGSGVWAAGEFKFDARLGEVQPAAIDQRLAAVTVSGPVTLSGQASAAPQRLQAKGDLRGHSSRNPSRIVQVKFDAAGNAQRIELREFLASAGAAKATLQGSALRSAPDSPWQLAGKVALADFDPLAWFPASADSRWRAGPHRLTAQADFALTVPAALVRSNASQNWPRHLNELRGSASIKLGNSLLAGVPVSGTLSLSSDAGGRVQVNARADFAGNLFQAVGEFDSRTEGRADHWEVAGNAPALARLTPLLRLAPASFGLAEPISGTLSLQAQIDGRWPALQGQGRLNAAALRFGDFSVASAQTSARFGTLAEAPLEVRAELTQASHGHQQVDSASLALQGSVRAHTLDLHAQLRAVPPGWTKALQANGSDAGDAARTLVSVRAQGGIVEPAAPGADAQARQWRGTLQALELRGNTPGATPWVRTQDVGLEVQLAGTTRMWAVAVSPGRGEVLGAVLRWQRFAWQAGDGARAAPIVELQAELEPLLLAPLLARVQPDFGWGGDLAITGHIKLRSAPVLSADVVLERARGDLSVTDEVGTQQLGLTDLRVALDARDGVWALTQGLAGKTLGVAAGAVTARVAPHVMWPPSDTPIQGVLEAQVANLGTWGAWVPAGWRLGGSLRTSAVIGGRLGAPEYTGEMRGTGISVRNAVQGVNVSDGEVAVSLQGERARIERFDAKAGAGTARLEGSASLGDAPKAQLRLVADHFQLLGRVDRRIVASGTAQLALDAQALVLEGRMGIDEGLVDFSRGDAPGLSDDVVVTGRNHAEAKPVTATGRARNVTLDLQVELGERLRLRGRGLDTGLRGELRLTAPAGRLAVNGKVRAVDGTYAAYGQKLSIDRGVLAFSGLAENPRLDIEATRPNLDLRVGVAVTGTALNPRVRLFSEPEMSDTDKLSWLLLGRAADGLGRTDTALLQRAALALLAGEGDSITDPVTRAIGLDEVSVRQTEGDVRETVVSLGKQLSRRWYVGYERGLNATTGTWQLIYRIAQRFTLRAQSGLDNSLDVIWTWRWQ